MNKKLVGLVLALVMLTVTSLAFASPSKTTTDLGRATGGTTTTGGTLPLNVTVLTTGLAAQAASDELAAIAGFTQQGAPLIEYFDPAVQAAIGALLPQGFDAKGLGMNELLPISVTGTVTGGAILSFEFATQYQEGQTLVAMVGVRSGGTVTWYPLPAEVVGGVVRVHFTQEVLEKMQTGTAMLAILS